MFATGLLEILFSLTYIETFIYIYLIIGILRASLHSCLLIILKAKIIYMYMYIMNDKQRNSLYF